MIWMLRAVVPVCFFVACLFSLGGGVRKKSFGKIWKIFEKVLIFAAAFRLNRELRKSILDIIT